jgi:hypothetical protein
MATTGSCDQQAAMSKNIAVFSDGCLSMRLYTICPIWVVTWLQRRIIGYLGFALLRPGKMQWLCRVLRTPNFLGLRKLTCQYPPQIELFAVDLHKNFINVESVSVALVPSLQPSGIFGSELNTPEADGFIADDIWRESVTLVSIHCLIIRSDRLTCQYPRHLCTP